MAKLCHRVNCADCNKLGYADEFQRSGIQNYLCVRCSNTHIDWNHIKKGGK